MLHSGASGKFEVRLVHISQSKYKINQFRFISSRSKQFLSSAYCHSILLFFPYAELPKQLFLKPRYKLDHREITLEKLRFISLLGGEIAFLFLF